jgi:hypothetical protein
MTIKEWRYNTNTGVLTTEMFESVVSKAKTLANLALT